MGKVLSHYYDVTPVVDYKRFVELYLLVSANPNDKGNIVANIPIDFLEMIQKLMYSFKEKRLLEFFSIIDYAVYYDRQLIWEKEITREFNDYTRNSEYIKQEYDSQK